MKSHNRTTSVSSPLKQPYVQVAEQALFIAVLSGFFVMAGGFLGEVLSSHTDDRVATAPAPVKAAPPCDHAASC